MLNLIVKDIKNNEIIFKDTNNNKYHSRSVKTINDRLCKFRYKNQDIWVLKVVGKWTDFSRPFKLNKSLYENIHGWNDYIEAMKELVNKWQGYEVKDDFVPSEPNTSKFYAVKRGDINYEEKYYKHRQTWLSPFYFPIIIKVGSAIKDKLPQEFWDEYLSIVAGGTKAELTINHNRAIPRYIGGSAWSAYGLAN